MEQIVPILSTYVVAVKDEYLEEPVRLGTVNKIFERRIFSWNVIKQKMARHFLDGDKLTDESDKDSWTSLHEAAKRGQTDVCGFIMNSHVHEQNPFWGCFMTFGEGYKPFVIAAH